MYKTKTVNKSIQHICNPTVQNASDIGKKTVLHDSQFKTLQ